MSYSAFREGQETGGDPAERPDEVRRLLGMIGDRTDEMAPNEQRFVADCKDRLKRYGPKMQVSAKQLFWLRDLKENLL